MQFADTEIFRAIDRQLLNCEDNPLENIIRETVGFYYNISQQQPDFAGIAIAGLCCLAASLGYEQK